VGRAAACAASTFPIGIAAVLTGPPPSRPAREAPEPL
jgi:hypothetical protein